MPDCRTKRGRDKDDEDNAVRVFSWRAKIAQVYFGTNGTNFLCEAKETLTVACGECRWIKASLPGES